MESFEIDNGQYEVEQYMGGNLTTKENDLIKLNFLGLSISVFDRGELISTLMNNVIENKKKIYYGYSIGEIAYIKKHAEIYKYGQKSDIFVTDGRIFYLLARKHGLNLKYDISIPNLVLLVLELANKNHWSVFLLGSKEETNEAAQRRIKSLYPQIEKISGQNGYFNENELSKIFAHLKDNKYNIVLIGTSSPQKEKLAVEIRDQADVNIIIPCGGMIDVLAGVTKLTPLWAKKYGIASFYRLLQEPRRLFKRYLFIYSYLIFSFFPKYLYFVVLKKNKNYSIIDE